MCLLVTVNIRGYFFATSTYFSDNLETRWTVTYMASQSALMSTFVNFLTSVHASRHWGLTMNGRVSLGFSTRTK